MNKLSHLDKITLEKISKVKNWKALPALEIARRATLPIEAVTITLSRIGIKKI